MFRTGRKMRWFGIKDTLRGGALCSILREDSRQSKGAQADTHTLE